MMSTLTLYYKSLINRDKSFILDNPSNGSRMIETYLATLTKQVINGFQYVKHAVKINVKVNKSQEDLMMGYNSKDLNYCKIQNGSENPCYYFISGKKWISENTIQLELDMDTLNTFTFNSDYVINKKTLVKREHKNRWKDLSYDLIVRERHSLLSIPANTTIYGNWREDKRLKAYLNCSCSTFTINSSLTATADIDTSNGQWRLAITNHTDSASSPFITNISLKITTDSYGAIIDLKSEEINAPMYKKSEEEIQDATGIPWLLHYLNKNSINENAINEVNPVICRLIPKFSCVADVSAGGLRIQSALSDGDYVLFSPFIMAESPEKIQPYVMFIDALPYTIGMYDEVSFSYIIIHRSGSTYTAYILRNDGSSSLVTKTITISNIGDVAIENAPQSVRLFKDTTFFIPLYVVKNWQMSNYTLNGDTPITVSLLGEEFIDRTDARNIKIIEIPYAPTNITGDVELGLYMSPEWKYDSSNYCMYLYTENAKFENDFVSGVDCPFNQLFIDKNDLVASHTRDDAFENKILHSDYYRPKFVYDSFSLSFYLELLDQQKYAENYYNSKLEVKFIMSRNIVSKFCFVLPQYTLDKGMTDYPNVVNVARNNEQVLYTSQYINYLRTGYNYDLKSKQRNEIAGGVGLGLSIAGTIGGVIGSIATQNYPAAILSGVAGALAISSQIVNYAKNTAQAEQNIAQKLQEAQNQAVQVQNADDVDLLNAYGGNVAKLCTYEISDAMKQVMLDLFYYCGYKSNEQKVPNVVSRYYFNYLEADLVLTDTENLTEEIENDIIDKFSKGVTFLHYRPAEGYADFDFAQETNNIEVLS